MKTRPLWLLGEMNEQALDSKAFVQELMAIVKVRFQLDLDTAEDESF